MLIGCCWREGTADASTCPRVKIRARHWGFESGNPGCTRG
jgi:hypothetical protein